MPECARCHKNRGEWQCQVCKRVVCTDCARPGEMGVFCADHEPGKTGKGPFIEDRKTADLRNLFFAMLLLSIGVGAIYLLFRNFLRSLVEKLPPTAGFEGTVGALESAVFWIAGGLVALTIIIGLWYAVLRYRAGKEAVS